MRRPVHRRAVLPLTALLVLAAAGTANALPPNPWVPLPWSPEGDSPQDQFGYVVAPAGDVNGDGYSDVVVGAPGDEGPSSDAGRAFLFLGSANGLALVPAWTWSANLSNGATGVSVAGAGDVNGDGYADVVVGTPNANVSGNAFAGKISIFHGSPTGLPLAPTYERFNTPPTILQQFGFAVATAGDVNADGYADVLVGVPFHSQGGLQNRGAAHVFLGGASGLATTPVLTVLGADASANLGKSVSTAGDVDSDGFSDVVIGAPLALSGATVAGSVSLYRGFAGGVIATADTVIKGTFVGEECGASVANAGDVDADGYADVLIGRPGYLDGSGGGGRYELWRGGPSGLRAPPALIVNGSDHGERLGEKVATFGDLNGDGYAEFGASAPFDTTVTPHGKVIVHAGGPVTWPAYGVLLGTSAQGSAFGLSAATAGDVDGDGFSEIVVGDPFASVTPGGEEGAVSLFELVRSEPILMSIRPDPASQPGTKLGAALAITPGIDPSSFPHLVIGEPASGSGVIQVYNGQQNGVFPLPTYAVLGTEPGEAFGTRIVDAGDVDRDGWSDLLVSSPTLAGTGGTESGRVFLVRGINGTPLVRTAVMDGDQPFARIGSALGGRGDIDGDGYPDVVIGARDWDGPAGLTDCGKVWVRFGAPGGFEAMPWTAQGTQLGQGFGASVDLGDVDGDGYADVVVSSVSPLGVGAPAGKVTVYYGGPSAPLASGWTLEGVPPSPSFGTALAAAVDINADGVSDIVVGAPGEGGTGRVYLFQGARGRGRPVPIRWTQAGTQAGARFGAAIAGGGDVDGDGFGDFVIGEPGWDGGQSEEGRITIAYGGPVVPSLGPPIEGNLAGGELGTAIAPLADLTGDGFADVAAGAPLGTGRVLVFAGGGGFGLTPTPLLTLDLGGSSRLYPPTRVELGLLRAGSVLRTPAGRDRVGLEIEFVPQAQAFSGEAMVTFPPFDTGPPFPGLGSASGVSAEIQLPWSGVAYKVRTRMWTSSPFFPHSRWLRAEARERGDYDVRRGGTEVAVGGGIVSDGPRFSTIAPNPAPLGGGGGGSGAAIVRIAWELSQPSDVLLDVFDVRGARVRHLVDGVRPAGPSTATWDGRDDAGRSVPAGLYFLRLLSGSDSRAARAQVVLLP